MVNKAMDTAGVPRWRRIGWALGAALALGVVLAGCTIQEGDPNASRFGGDVVAQKVAVASAANDTNRWERDRYEATAGDITFVVHIADSRPHLFAIKGNGVSYRSDNLTPNSTSDLTIKALPAGDYQIVCDYHGGMTARLTVRPAA